MMEKFLNFDKSSLTAIEATKIQLPCLMKIDLSSLGINNVKTDRYNMEVISNIT